MKKGLVTRELSAGSTILVDGPASVMLTKGEADSLGAFLRRDVWYVLRRDQRLIVETPNSCSLEILLRKGGKHERVVGSPLPIGWREASQITAESPGLVVILGDVDSGKSTLATFLSNECFRRGRSVSIIDGDVGQADIGPPTSISMAHLSEAVLGLQHLAPDVSFFVGDTSPTTVSEKVLTGLAKLRDTAKKGSDTVIVNTDGWVKGEDATRYKEQLLETVQPDLLIGIQADTEIDQLLDWQHCTVLRLPRSSYARIRSREVRKRTRELSYQRFLRNASPVNLSLDKLKLRRYNSFHQTKLDPRENLRGLIAGLLDAEDRLQSIARVEGLRGNVLRLWTVLNGAPSTVELGSVVLSSKYTELGYDS